jgi:hypothetical protein
MPVVGSPPPLLLPLPLELELPELDPLPDPLAPELDPLPEPDPEPLLEPEPELVESAPPSEPDEDEPGVELHAAETPARTSSSRVRASRRATVMTAPPRLVAYSG